MAAGLSCLSGLQLAACLEQLPPADLLGLALLKQYQPPAPGSWFPSAVPLDQVIQATTQLVAYGAACRQAAHKLIALPPVPLALPILEYAL